MAGETLTTQQLIDFNAGEVLFGLENGQSRSGYNYYDFVFPGNFPGVWPEDPTRIRLTGTPVLCEEIKTYLQSIYSLVSIETRLDFEVSRCVPGLIEMIYPDLIRYAEVKNGLGYGVMITRIAMDSPTIQLSETLEDGSFHGLRPGFDSLFSVSATFPEGRDLLQDYPDQVAGINLAISQLGSLNN